MIPGRMLVVVALASTVAFASVALTSAFMVMFALVAEAGPARMTVITYVSPAVAILLGAVVLDEPLTIGLAIGFPLVIIGSVLGTWRSAPAPVEPTGVGTESGGTEVEASREISRP